MSLTQAIKNEAHRLGFSLVGVTTSEPPLHWATYQHWLSMGRHASMGYLADHRRADPHLLLSECRSILVLAARYPDPNSAPLNEIPRLAGRVAAYAWGGDYHISLPERLKLLVSFIETRVGSSIPHRWYTDTGPVLERDLAQRAGLGWIGKNTNLINPSIGSYLLLAEILLGMELEPDKPFSADRCGTCTRCIKACPTGCILPNRTLDAGSCLSYLTIENKIEIPPDLRPQLGNLVFGCDICQQACPWNRFTNVETMVIKQIQEFGPLIEPRPGFSNPDLVAELTLTRQEFNQKFKGNPVLRSKWRGYLRNVAVALGNSMDPAALPVLQKAVEIDEPLIREHALWALQQIQKDNHDHT